MGASVALLEAHDIGYGGSGRNVGLVNAGLWLTPETIVAQMGGVEGRHLIDVLGRAPDLVFDLIDRHDIACEATRAGTLHLAHAPSGLRDLEDRYRQGNQFGAALQLLNAEEARARTGSEAFHGALFNASAGTVQPLGYCHGLARAAQQAGAQFFGQSSVQALRQDGTGNWQVMTPQGIVRAPKLLLATNAYAFGAAVPEQPQYVPVHYCQFATAPLTAQQQARILPGGEGCWDTAQVMSSVRRDAAGRLIVGGMGNSNGAGARLHAAWARHKLRSLFPELDDIPFEHHWSGRIAMTSDHVPKIQIFGPNAYSIFGYSGRGIGPGTVFGRAAAEALLTEDETGLPLPAVEQYSERFTAAKGAFFEFGATMVHTLNRLR
jgi:glycine/D-amino acid oxidase-like deaminating enzyme